MITPGVSVADRLRSVALGLAAVEERETWGKPTFRVAGKLFLTLGADGTTATMKATFGDQAALIAAEPTVFSAAAYLGRYGWITVSLASCDPDEIAALVIDAWHHSAPRHLTDPRTRTTRPRREPVPVDHPPTRRTSVRTAGGGVSVPRRGSRSTDRGS